MQLFSHVTPPPRCDIANTRMVQEGYPQRVASLIDLGQQPVKL